MQICDKGKGRGDRCGKGKMKGDRCGKRMGRRDKMEYMEIKSKGKTG